MRLIVFLLLISSTLLSQIQQKFTLGGADQNAYLDGALAIPFFDTITASSSGGVELAYTQYMWTHESAQVSDDIGEFHINYDSLRSALTPTITGSYTFSIVTDTSGLFSFDSGTQKIDISSITGLQTNVIYYIIVQTSVHSYTDLDTVYIEVIDTDDAFYVDLDAGSNGVGTYADPFNNPIETMVTAKSYFYKRGTYYRLQGDRINFANDSKILTYDTGARPRMSIYKNDGNDDRIQIGIGDNDCVIYGLELDCRSFPSRAIQNTRANNTKILNCKIDSASNGIWTDQQDNTTGTCSGLLIQNNEINMSGEDPMHTEMEFSTMIGNIMRDVSVVGVGGDGNHTTWNFNNYMAYNWVFTGDWATNKACWLFKSDGTGAGPDYQPAAPNGYPLRSTFEHNTLWGGQNQVGGINVMGQDADIRYNFCYVYNNTFGTSTGMGGVYNTNIRMHHNYIGGWNAGHACRNDSIYVFNNIFEDCVKVFVGDINTNPGAKSFDLMTRNNITIDCDSTYGMKTTIGTLDLDYSIINADAPSRIQGTTYANFAAVQGAGYDANSFINVPDLTSINKPTIGGNLINAGTSILSIINSTVDFGGNTIGTPPELGVYEYVP